MISSLKHFLVPALAIVVPLSAQFGPSPGGSSNTRAVQLPLSGTVQSNTQGSVPGGDTVTQEPLALTLSQAVARSSSHDYAQAAEDQIV